ncbi:hypothetical protein [Streptomyces buecherae]|uniref:hypothetical protein n=1 Tax=Streptomyces buecherae TaxID=2763006 RepID=UPI00367BB148
MLVRFEVTGEGPLASLAYTVNGRFTTLHDVPLTWRKSVPVARRQGRVDWRLRLTAPRLPSGAGYAWTARSSGTARTRSAR